MAVTQFRKLSPTVVMATLSSHVTSMRRQFVLHCSSAHLGCRVCLYVPLFMLGAAVSAFPHSNHCFSVQTHTLLTCAQFIPGASWSSTRISPCFLAHTHKCVKPICLILPSLLQRTPVSLNLL